MVIIITCNFCAEFFGIKRFRLKMYEVYALVKHEFWCPACKHYHPRGTKVEVIGTVGGVNISGGLGGVEILGEVVGGNKIIVNK